MMDPPVARTAGRLGSRDQMVHIRLTQAGLAALDAFADREQRTRSDMIRLLLHDGIEARNARLGKR